MLKVQCQKRENPVVNFGDSDALMKRDPQDEKVGALCTGHGLNSPAMVVATAITSQGRLQMGPEGSWSTFQGVHLALDSQRRESFAF
ncbi:hypothetical protein N7528_003472 [Penicillium herquei]|nr:hypothetical protein N7528_003472 [Penicillium herquei]